MWDPLERPHVGPCEFRNVTWVELSLERVRTARERIKMSWWYMTINGPNNWAIYGRIFTIRVNPADSPRLNSTSNRKKSCHSYYHQQASETRTLLAYVTVRKTVKCCRLKCGNTVKILRSLSSPTETWGLQLGFDLKAYCNAVPVNRILASKFDVAPSSCRVARRNRHSWLSACSKQRSATSRQLYKRYTRDLNNNERDLP